MRRDQRARRDRLTGSGRPVAPGGRLPAEQPWRRVSLTGGHRVTDGDDQVPGFTRAAAADAEAAGQRDNRRTTQDRERAFAQGIPTDQLTLRQPLLHFHASERLAPCS